MNEILINKIYEIPNYINVCEAKNLLDKYLNKKTERNFTETGQFDDNKFIDQNLADYFYELLDVYTKGKLCDINIYKTNKYIMTAKYQTNEGFSIHTDTGLYFNYKENKGSKFTFLIYLNDDYTGGVTIFYFKENQISIKPKVGKSIKFDMEIPYCGDKIISGDKYWIGCEIISDII